MTQLVFRLTAILILAFPACVLAQASVEERIQDLSEQLLLGSEVTVAGVTLASAHIIPELYSRRQFSPAWTDENRVDEFIQLVGQAKDEGLNPADYGHAELLALISQYRSDRTNATLRADVDLLLTESISRYGHHLFFGKVDPASLDENWNWSRSLEVVDPAAIIQEAIDSDSLATFIDATLQRGPVYKRVKAMLAEYRALGENGGWPQIDAGPTLKPGMTDDRIPVIRKRLAVTGDLAESADNGSHEFDAAL
jgi:murein L,D-transpeptidase YcbB/YkuD